MALLLEDDVQYSVIGVSLVREVESATTNVAIPRRRDGVSTKERSQMAFSLSIRVKKSRNPGNVILP